MQNVSQARVAPVRFNGGMVKSVTQWLQMQGWRVMPHIPALLHTGWHPLLSPNTPGLEGLLDRSNIQETNAECRTGGLSFFLLIFSLDLISLCSSDCPGTCYVAQASLNFLCLSWYTSHCVSLAQHHYLCVRSGARAGSCGGGSSFAL